MEIDPVQARKKGETGTDGAKTRLRHVLTLSETATMALGLAKRDLVFAKRKEKKNPMGTVGSGPLVTGGSNEAWTALHTFK